jgi:ABC-2 type transport system permease protein
VVRTVATVLPFRWLVSFPVELMLGRVSPSEALAGLGLQLFWSMAIFALFSRLWKEGVKRYSAVGA